MILFFHAQEPTTPVVPSLLAARRYQSGITASYFEQGVIPVGKQQATPETSYPFCSFCNGLRSSIAGRKRVRQGVSFLNVIDGDDDLGCRLRWPLRYCVFVANFCEWLALWWSCRGMAGRDTRLMLISIENLGEW